ncbi:hypothetical protein CAPTEDRAFT_48074, partial [Capitella teleta]
LIENGSDINQRDSDGKSSLLYAIGGGYVCIAKRLLESGANPNTQTKFGASVLHCAAGKGLVKPLRMLLEQCGDVSVNEEDNFGSTLLHYAAFNNRTNTIQFLLQLGCKKDKKDHKGRTAADLAKLMGYGDIVQLL